MKKEIGKIDAVFFGIEDHGILAFNFSLDFGGSHQGTGAFNLQFDRSWILVKDLMTFFGVYSWEGIKGQTVYALYDSESNNSMIRGFERLPFDGGKRIIFAEAIKLAELGRRSG